MRSQLLEARVLSCVEIVLRGGRVEDDLVECKAGWIDPAKAARRIAGGANAAHGQDLIWIIGLNESGHSVADADGDPADWWAQVKRRFDGVAPEMSCLSIPVGGGKAVTALRFSTDRAPYVVTTDGRGGVNQEVPWRDGTAIRSASRRELIRILVPLVAIPSIEVVAALGGTQGTYPKDPSRMRINFAGTIYCEATTASSMPLHRARVALTIPDDETLSIDGVIQFAPTGQHVSGQFNPDVQHNRGIALSAGTLHVDGAGAIRFYADFAVPAQHPAIRAPEILFKLSMPVAGIDKHASCTTSLILDQASPPHQQWKQSKGISSQD